MKEFTPGQLASHLRWVYSQPGYYKEEHERSRNRKRKTLSGSDQALHRRSRRRSGKD